MPSAPASNAANVPMTGRSEVTLGDERSVNTQMWHLRPADDEATFAIGAPTGNFALDSPGAPDHRQSPLLWTANAERWQQWLILRLPLANEKKADATDDPQV
jgi:hypothetical protein